MLHNHKYMTLQRAVVPYLQIFLEGSKVDTFHLHRRKVKRTGLNDNKGEFTLTIEEKYLSKVG